MLTESVIDFIVGRKKLNDEVLSTNEKFEISKQKIINDN